MVETTRVYMRRLATQHRNLVTSRLQANLSIKKKRAARKPTPEELKDRRERKKASDLNFNDKITRAQAILWEVFEGLATDLGKTPAHWQRHLMQLLRVAMSERKTSRWNAFLSISLEKVNAGK